MLDVIGAGNPDYKGQDWGDVWARSTQHSQLSEQIEKIIQERRNKEIEGGKDDHREYAMPIWVQILTVSKRSFVAYWRTPQYALVCPESLHCTYNQPSDHSAGQILASCFHRALQHFHFLAPRKQLH